MIDKTYRILLERYMPDSPLLVVQEPEPVEVQKAAITLENLLLQVRSEMLSSWGLDPEDRHSFVDDIVAMAAVQKCTEFNVINMPSGGIE